MEAALRRSSYNPDEDSEMAAIHRPSGVHRSSFLQRLEDEAEEDMDVLSVAARLALLHERITRVKDEVANVDERVPWAKDVLQRAGVPEPECAVDISTYEEDEEGEDADGEAEAEAGGASDAGSPANKAQESTDREAGANGGLAESGHLLPDDIVRAEAVLKRAANLHNELNTLHNFIEDTEELQRTIEGDVVVPHDMTLEQAYIKADEAMAQVQQAMNLLSTADTEASVERSQRRLRKAKIRLRAAERVVKTLAPSAEPNSQLRSPERGSNATNMDWHAGAMGEYGMSSRASTMMDPAEMLRRRQELCEAIMAARQAHAAYAERNSDVQASLAEMLYKKQKEGNKHAPMRQAESAARYMNIMDSLHELEDTEEGAKKRYAEQVGENCRRTPSLPIFIVLLLAASPTLITITHTPPASICVRLLSSRSFRRSARNRWPKRKRILPSTGRASRTSVSAGRAACVFALTSSRRWMRSSRPMSSAWLSSAVGSRA
jgi:hypothetical protein